MLTPAFSDHISEPRIIDYGASDHMKGNLLLISSYSLCDVSRSVKIANGSLFTISGTGSVFLSSKICLANVLYIFPIFLCNLVSKSKLIAISHLNYVLDHMFVIFRKRIRDE